MNRQLFKTWGLELTPDEFAQALAALGTLHHLNNWSHLSKRDVEEIAAILDHAFANAPEEPLRWLIVTPEQWEQSPASPPPARILAEAWSKFIEQYREPPPGEYSTQSERRVRLEVTKLHDELPERTDYFWLVEELSRPAVGVVSVYVRSENPSARISWNWPLQVGFLPDETSRELRESVEALCHEGGWMARLIEIVTLEAGRSSCDLLLLPFELREALVSVLRYAPSARADCVLVLGRVKDSPQRALPLVHAMQSHMRTGGVGLFYVQYDDRLAWFKELIRELSHDNTIDVALYRACRSVEARPPVLMASRRLAKFSRVSTTLKKMGGHFITEENSDLPIIISEHMSRTIGLPEGETTLEKVGEQLRGGAVDFSFNSESEMATAAVEIKELSRDIFESMPLPKPPERRIQALVYDLSGSDTAGAEGRGSADNRKLLRSALRANAPHEVVVQIGSARVDWISASQPFDDSLLPDDQTIHELTVVFTEPRLVTDPQRAKILLPAGGGDSTQCKFYFHTGNEVKDFQARIIILHRNRVLQTALLRAKIVSDPDEAPPNMQMDLTIPEAVVRPGLIGLEDRQRFDGVILLNHDQERTPGVTKISDQAASFHSPQELGQIVEFFDKKFTEIADNKDDFEEGLKAKGTVNLLRDCAQWGVLLYRNIVKDKIGVEDPIAKGSRIQILSAEPEARLPLEFIYDRKSPTDTAVLCEHAAEALADNALTPEGLVKDTCPAQCPVGPAKAGVICPLGFWGLKKILERHAHDPSFKPETLKGDFRLQSEPVESRNHLNVLGAALMAASHRVDKKRAGGVDSVRAALKKATNQDPAMVSSWTDWVTAIQEKKPSLLVLLTHTAKTDNLRQKLEISEEQWLTVSDVDEDYIRNPRENPAPLVVLMGCETGAPEIPLLSLVSAFRGSGAAIVVSTGATILGRHATPVTEEFVATLAELAKTSKASFGEVMLNVRRRAMAKGLPMVLCLMSYGDADWQIGTP
jgi:hypothetical protein